ncbi:hypothetical protein [Parasitella parasitica]|uniref:Uncharacterized protein n=1 Tax=Parasitella parasitica TaxID=35722 RepID=A0A0B7NMK2_9FUNG|nr:hypothetical protein [Parasitella parasitica]
MDEETKWRLSSGKCVEDEVYCFGMQCSVEHQAHSYIIDSSDKNWVKYEVFNEKELEEIDSYQPKNTPEMPEPLREYLNQFNKSTTNSIRKEVFKEMEMDQNFDPKQHFDYDWIRDTCYNLLMEYEAKSLQKPHNEEWFKAHIWNFNDTVCNQSDIEVARGEVASTSSALRKNKERACDGIDIYRKKMGSKCDMLFRDAALSNEYVGEYGASETGSKYDGETGTKLLNEGYLKVPKTFKDMLDNLCVLYPDVPFNQLEVVGYVHAGLFSQVLRVDRPTQYMTRVTRLEPSIIRNEVSYFGTSVLPAIYKSYIVREIVQKVQNICYTSNLSANTEDSSWLLNCVKRNRSDSLIPQTSTSKKIS